MKTATNISTNDQAALLAVARNAVDHLKQLQAISEFDARHLAGYGAKASGPVFSAFATDSVIDALISLLERNDPEHFTNRSNLYLATRR